MARVTCVLVVMTLTALFPPTNTKEDSGKCYEGLGCFPLVQPWFSILRPFPPPQTPSEINTRLYCYTREDPSKRHTVSLWPNISISGLPFSANRSTVFITHGFYSNGNETWMDKMKDAYLSTVDANVCKVDWGEGADTINYLQVASNTRVVGAEIARFIRFLQSEYGVKASSLHLIGHSLGSHVSAYAANNVTGVSRITGLDVAQPGFENYDKVTHLDQSDAEFVDAIHTNGAPFFPDKGLGFINPLGHVDFYMNDGKFQPGCTIVHIMTSALSVLSGLSELANTAASAVMDWSGCSHGRSFEYYTAALRHNCSIWGLASTVNTVKLFSNTNVNTVVSQCNASTCIPLGLHTPEFPGRGVFTANTPNMKPYCWTAKDNNAVVEHILAAADGLSEKLISVIKGFSR